VEEETVRAVGIVREVVGIGCAVETVLAAVGIGEPAVGIEAVEIPPRVDDSWLLEDCWGVLLESCWRGVRRHF
jgi:hypothetical protein